MEEDNDDDDDDEGRTIMARVMREGGEEKGKNIEMCLEGGE